MKTRFKVGDPVHVSGIGEAHVVKVVKTKAGDTYVVRPVRGDGRRAAEVGAEAKDMTPIKREAE